MEGSHLISPCVWQNDVNRTYCIVGSDWIEKAFRIFPTLQILGVCDNNTGSTRVKCSMLFILLKYPVYKSWETSEVQRTLLYQPLMRSRTREAEISFEWALLLLTPKRACSHRKFLIPTKNSRFPLRLCGSPLFICYYFDQCFYFRIIRSAVSGHHDHVTDEREMSRFWCRVRGVNCFRFRTQQNSLHSI